MLGVFSVQKGSHVLAKHVGGEHSIPYGNPAEKRMNPRERPALVSPE